MSDTLAANFTSQPFGSDLLRTIDQLLRDAPATVERIRQERELASLARALLLTIAVGGALFGASMGAFRGGVQILYAAVKLPLAMLLATAVCAPALTTLNATLGRPASLRRDVALVLGGLGRASLVLAALAPVVQLAVRVNTSYHSLTLLVTLCCLIAGIVGLGMVLEGVRSGSDRSVRTVALGLLTIFGLVGTQMAWTLRPFMLRPRTPDIVFVRSIEGSFIEAVTVSVRSARGIYARPAAPLPSVVEEE